jgi:hypothetical protein
LDVRYALQYLSKLGEAQDEALRRKGEG